MGGPGDFYFFCVLGWSAINPMDQRVIVDRDMLYNSGPQDSCLRPILVHAWKCLSPERSVLLGHLSQCRRQIILRGAQAQRSRTNRTPVAQDQVSLSPGMGTDSPRTTEIDSSGGAANPQRAKPGSHCGPVWVGLIKRTELSRLLGLFSL